MNIQEANRQIAEKIRRVEEYMADKAKEAIGLECVRHFNDSFVQQGFTDKGLKKWDDVKRRDPDSPWYGFDYQSNSPRPGKEQRAKNKDKRLKPKGDTNFSPVATRSMILKDTGAMKEATKFEKLPNGVRITNDSKYAKVHNEGGTAKVFGKATSVIPKRQFIGHSEVLNGKIRERIEADLASLKSLKI